MDNDTLATIGANLEANFDAYSTSTAGETLDISFTTASNPQTQTMQLTLVSTESIPNPYGESVKCITFKDAQGNLYVHFRGTGDGNWEYNTSAFSDTPSDIQTKSLEYFDRVIEEHYQNNPNRGKVYVSGHSQGGNTAQYVTLSSKYGDYIDTCTSLDGPGFGKGLVQNMKAKYGEGHFNKQCQKIYAYNGENDFVSPLGQEHVIPEGHTTFVKAPSGEGVGIADYHDVRGMMNGQSLNTYCKPNQGSPFRDLVVGLNQKIVSDLPLEEQERAARLAMKFAEYLMGTGKGTNVQPTLTPEDLEGLKELVIPLLVEYLAEHPEMIRPALEALGLSPETAELVEKLILQFNELPEEQRKDALEGFCECIVITEDGKLDITPDAKGIIQGILLALPAIIETGLENPEQIIQVLKEYGVWDKIQQFITEHPLITIIGVILIAYNLPKIVAFFSTVITNITKLVYLIEAIYQLVEDLKDLAEDIKEFVLNALQAIKETIGKFKEYLRSLTPGSKYAASNPYFKADPTLMRSYADRLKSVNSRLAALDIDLDSLYQQVGLLDILDILQANILISYNGRIWSAEQYLRSAATTIETADNTALGYMGG